MAIRNNTFILKVSNVTGKTPTLAQLSIGEIAINVADAKLHSLYTGGATGATEVREIGWNRFPITGGTLSGSMSATSISATTFYGNASNLTGFTSATTFTTQSFTATSSQSIFTIGGGYTTGLIKVYYNGSKLNSTEFSATNGTTIGLTIPANLNDVVDVETFTPSTVSPSKSFVVLTYGATITWDFSTGYNKEVTLTGAATLAISNDADGDYGTLFVTQDGTGARVLTLPAGDNSTGVSITTVSGTTSIYSYVKKGNIRYWNASTR